MMILMVKKIAANQEYGIVSVDLSVRIVREAVRLLDGLHSDPTYKVRTRAQHEVKRMRISARMGPRGEI